LLPQSNDDPAEVCDETILSLLLGPVFGGH
jgi:hypothetical protein